MIVLSGAGREGQGKGEESGGEETNLSLPTGHRNIHKPPRVCDSLLRSALGCLLLLLGFDLFATNRLSAT